MERPTGITILAILSGISGLLGICGALPVFGISLLGGVVAPPVAVVGGIVGILLIIGPILQLAFAYGAWFLRPWAWMLGIIGTGISVLSTIIAIVGSAGAALPSAITNGLLPIIIFIYLLTPDVRRAFRA